MRSAGRLQTIIAERSVFESNGWRSSMALAVESSVYKQKRLTFD